MQREDDAEVGSGPQIKPTRDPTVRLAEGLNNFSDQMAALFLFRSRLTPLGKAIDRNETSKRMRESMARYANDTQRDPSVLMRALAKSMTAALGDGNHHDLPTELNEEEQEVVRILGLEFDVSNDGMTLRFRNDDDERRRDANFLRVLTDTGANSSRQEELLCRSALNATISTFEVLVGDLLRVFLTRRKGATWDSKEPVLSLDELLTYRDIDEAVDAVLDQRIDGFMRKGLDEWVKWFKSGPLKVDLPSLTGRWDQVEEYFARRNLVVHNNGLVDRQYIRQSRIEGEGVKLGQRLRVSDSYVRDVQEHLLGLGTNLAFEVWSKTNPNQLEVASEWVCAQARMSLENDRPNACLSISRMCATRAVPEATALTLRVYSWMASARLGDDSHKQEVLAWDTSALSGVFTVMRSFLLGETDSARRLFAELLARGEINDECLERFPVLKSLGEPS